MSVIGLIKRSMRAMGYDVVRLPGPETLGAHLIKLFRLLGIDCVLDVGAHHGEYGQLLLNHGYGGEIISFEPISQNLSVVRERASNYSRWTVHGHALGAIDGELAINITSGTDLSSFLRPNNYIAERLPRLSFVCRSENVPIRRLDSIFNAIAANKCVFLKMDTQGFDLEVIAGASGCLQHIAGLQSEMSAIPMYEGMPDYLESLSTLSALGFRPSAVFPVSRTAKLCLEEFDCVMLRAGANHCR